MPPALLVLDVGKTHAKFTLLGVEGTILEVRTRANAALKMEGRRVLDVAGIDAWMLATIRELAAMAEVLAIIPVGHGAAAALVDGNGLAAPVLDYEAAPPADIAAAYAAERDAFALTGSPALPGGLNLGQQLFWQESLYPGLWPQRARAMLWPQYWAWRLSGEAACEVTSLGCHSDLWRPYAKSFSGLAQRRGWDERLGPRRAAAETLATVTARIAQATGLPRDCVVLCGLHDSNASLHAARGFDEVRDAAFALISTGTWFIAFQSGGGGAPERLDPDRDVLANVDVAGRPTPSARFMGGREYAAIVGEDFSAVAGPGDMDSLLRGGAATRPSFIPGCGPFPKAVGTVTGAPRTPGERAALASLHLALMADASLGLIAAEGPIVIEGRFAEDAVFTAALAALRPASPVFACPDGDRIAYGAARLWRPHLAPAQPLRRVSPLEADLTAYAERWRDQIAPTS
jgi:sugar (pentulose or hexulose) kinase